MYNEINLEKIEINSDPPAKEPDRQYYFIAKCREWVREFERENGRCPTACVQTFGCQMNARDSEKLRGILGQAGLENCGKEEADFVLYNTCTVRDHANQKVYGRLGYLQTLKKKNPRMKIALCGCMMQEPTVVERIQKSYPFVDLIFGTHNIYKLAELLYCCLTERGMVVDVWDSADAVVEDLPAERKYSFKSGVNIMYGCNNFCSYCIVPYVRGRERSREPGEILAEIRRLAADGVKEVMLLGQNVNSYGKNLSEPVSFAELLRQVDCIDGIERIRFMTSHPKDLSSELILAMKECKKVCRHLHLPLQSGSSRILERMNRRYTKEQYLELVNRIRQAIPDISLTTDIIVGFPGETEADFEETLDVVRRVRYDSAFTFIYSKRTKTPAASMGDQVDPVVVKERFERLLREVQQISSQVCMRDAHTIQEVLVECENDHQEGYVSGRLSNNLLVHFPGDPSLVGKLVSVELTEPKGFYYIGRMVDRTEVENEWIITDDGAVCGDKEAI